MLSNTYAIRAGAQQFASAADGMRQKANGIHQNDAMLAEKWRGKAADAFHSVSDLLGEDIQTASRAFEQAAHALHVLAGQLDQVNSLRQQVDQLTSQIQSLEWSLHSADDHQRAAISSEISQLAYRRSNFQYEADSLEHQANTGASAAFHDIAGMVNHLHFFHGTAAPKASDSTALDQIGHFFSGLWHKAESAVEDAYQEVSQEFQKVGNEIEQAFDEFQNHAKQGGWFGGVVGFVEGFLESIYDTLSFCAKVNPANILANAVMHPEATYEKAKAIFKDLEHPVQTAERFFDGAKVVWSTLKQSYNRDIVHGNAFTRSHWGGYAAGMIAQVIATGGAGAAAKGGEEVAAAVTEEMSQAVKGITEADAAKLDGWKYRPTNEKYLKYKDVYDNPKYYNQETGDVQWPPNHGFEGNPEKMTLEEGMLLDRYGDPGGSFFSPEGISYESRALALHSDEANYYVYKVIEPFEVEAGKIAPWFGREGGGIQFVKYHEDGTKYMMQELIKEGYIKLVSVNKGRVFP